MSMRMTAREDTFDKVTAALLKLSAKGVAITVKGVAQKAGVARATIYNDPDLLYVVQNWTTERQHQDAYAAGYIAGERGDKPTNNTTDEWARGVMHIAPGETVTAELLKRRRAQLSFFFHPDKGGDTALQQSLNQAFDILKRRVA